MGKQDGVLATAPDIDTYFLIADIEYFTSRLRKNGDLPGAPGEPMGLSPKPYSPAREQAGEYAAHGLEQASYRLEANITERCQRYCDHGKSILVHIPG